MKTILILGAAAVTFALAGCSSSPSAHTRTASPTATAKGGGYYLDDGPEANPPSNLGAIPDAVPRIALPTAPMSRWATPTRRAPSTKPIVKKAWPRGTAAVFTARKPHPVNCMTCTP
jgi:hypothetical protein